VTVKALADVTMNEYSWFLFSVIIKSMTLVLHRKKLLESPISIYMILDYSHLIFVSCRH